METRSRGEEAGQGSLSMCPLRVALKLVGFDVAATADATKSEVRCAELTPLRPLGSGAHAREEEEQQKE